MTPEIASDIIELFILDTPWVRFLNVIGISLKLYPRFQSLNFISIWKAYPTNIILFKSYELAKWMKQKRIKINNIVVDKKSFVIPLIIIKKK